MYLWSRQCYRDKPLNRQNRRGRSVLKWQRTTVTWKNKYEAATETIPSLQKYCYLISNFSLCKLPHLLDFANTDIKLYSVTARVKF